MWEKTAATGFLNAKKQPLRAHELISVFYQKQPAYNPQKTGGHVRKSSNGGFGKTQVYGDMDNKRYYDSTERYPRSVIKFPKDTQTSSYHPTQKPVPLLEWLIKTYSNAGDTVLDNTMGSGSTGVACRNTGRYFIGIERDRKYFDIARERISNV